MIITAIFTTSVALFIGYYVGSKVWETKYLDLQNTIQQATIKQMEDRQETQKVLDTELSASIDKFTRTVRNTEREMNRLKTNIRTIKTTTVEGCNPTEEFIKAWNEAN